MGARGLNKVRIIGNLGADPEVTCTATGTVVANFRVAVGRRWRGPDGKTVEEIEWFRVVAREKLGGTCNEYLRKGRRVYVEGRLQSHRHTDKAGIERTVWEVVASDVVMLGERDGREEGGADAGVPTVTAVAVPAVTAAAVTPPPRVSVSTTVQRRSPPLYADLDDADVPF